MGLFKKKKPIEVEEKQKDVKREVKVTKLYYNTLRNPDVDKNILASIEINNNGNLVIPHSIRQDDFNDEVYIKYWEIDKNLILELVEKALEEKGQKLCTISDSGDDITELKITNKEIVKEVLKAFNKKGYDFNDSDSE